MSNPRHVAWELLQAVHVNDAYANLVMPTLLRQAALDQRDVGLATEIGYGALRRQGSLDAVIQACAARSDIDIQTLDVLRISAYQILFMRTPAHAAVDEAVELAKRVAGHGSAKFVNAVLRRVCERDWSSWCQHLSADLPAVDALALEYSFPTWVVRSLMDSYGLDLVTVVPLLASCNEPAQVVLAARPGQCDPDELLAIAGTRPGARSSRAVVLPRGMAPGDIPAVREQRAGVQDEGSQLVALALAQAPVAGDESRWLDLCAGPGGKAALLAGWAAERGITLTAVEPNPTRAALVESALAGAPGQPMVVCQDGRQVQGTFDRILIDAPCSGLGSLRRRPEARWRKQPGDIPALAALQRELLDHAAGLVRPGGIIGYSTCSPHLAETDVVVARFLRTHLDFEGAADPMRLRTDLDGTDGMFLALLRRRA